MARSTLDNMAWHNDTLVRDIGSEVDDRSHAEIAESVTEVYESYDRSIGESEATSHLTQKQAGDAAVLASAIVDWAEYGESYGDYSNPPWKRSNPRRKTAKRKATKRKAAAKRTPAVKKSLSTKNQDTRRRLRAALR